MGEERNQRDRYVAILAGRTNSLADIRQTNNLRLSLSSAVEIHREASGNHLHSRRPRRAIPSKVQLRRELFLECVGRSEDLSERTRFNGLWQDVRTPR